MSIKDTLYLLDMVPTVGVFHWGEQGASQGRSESTDRDLETAGVQGGQVVPSRRP